ncbi:MAG: hypothetical protein ACP5NV_00740 [Candidatus Woesearchaeota archaeon]
MRAKGTVLENCPFCGRQAIVMNPQDVAVCTTHKDAYLDLKCVCGQPLDILKGKYGTYGNCLKCGNISLKKALDINDTLKAMPSLKLQSKDIGADLSKKQLKFGEHNDKPKDTIIRSDDPDYFD